MNTHELLIRILNTIVTQLTISISYMGRISKSNCHNQADYHKNPVYLWYICLTINPPSGMYCLNTRETFKCMALLDNWECRRDDSLTCNYCCQSSHHKYRPKEDICKMTKTSLHSHFIFLFYINHSILIENILLDIVVSSTIMLYILLE
jgi:hypothetical protein